MDVTGPSRGVVARLGLICCNFVIVKVGNNRGQIMQGHYFCKYYYLFLINIVSLYLRFIFFLICCLSL